MIVERGQQFCGGEGRGACLVIKQLKTCREVVIAFAYGHFIFSAEGAGAVSIGKAVPLIVKDGLYPIVAREDTGEGGVAQQGRFEELRKMDVLRTGFESTEEANGQEKKSYE